MRDLGAKPPPNLIIFRRASFLKSYQQLYIGAFPGNINPVTYSDGCYNSAGSTPNLENDWKYQCLMTDVWNIEMREVHPSAGRMVKSDIARW